VKWDLTSIQLFGQKRPGDAQEFRRFFRRYLLLFDKDDLLAIRSSGKRLKNQCDDRLRELNFCILPQL
jgi:hypothetical protein